ncbi:SDR family NAD(P)-dependent oxidoreductase [Flavihumibacter petaseus]|uniref:Putative oxidoreductase n=1 Tax=Flavihumibacter petaseus NBRC 106054 TaxID=1220578 RepID=A0A0E9N7T3_9BACT|nr:SDR family NAD(P)-dependent oxidoreductase [Flavihumibacter petaseus]GAO45415.1 putative oxidoreductase [Flavihumibacter petaseus NBRC 106054]
MAKQSSKVWFITGASRGLGRIWTEAALERGDKVAATARTLSSITPLKDAYGDQVLTLQLDVTDLGQVKKAVMEAHAHFGRLDIVLNNAGVPVIGTIEEADPDAVRALYETNILGPVTVIQAVLPLLRRQGYGHIMGTSSNLGHLTLPFLGYYCSSKWAFEAIYESLAAEIAQFNLRVTIIEPGAYATEFGSGELSEFLTGLDVYKDYKVKFLEGMKGMERGNPAATPQALFAVVDAENPPLRFNLGSHNLPGLKAAYADRIATWEAWDALSRSAQ